MTNDDYMKSFPEGTIIKAATVDAAEVTPDDLKKINKLTLSPVKEEDVFVFKAVIGDNELDDRNFEPFNLQALKDLSRLYVGKTVIKDHRRLADNQIARVFDTELVSEAKTTSGGEAFAKLIAKCYMIRTASNADLIAEINGGIKREVSTSSRPKKAICSICGTDNVKTYCPHIPGRAYDGKTCMITLDGAKDVYELSLVAVPAQPRAGTTKHYGAEPKAEQPETPEVPETPETPEETPDTEEKSVDMRLRMASAFLAINRE